MNLGSRMGCRPLTLSDISDPKIFRLSSRDVFKVSGLGRYNCRTLIVGVGMRRREFSPDRPAVNSAGWNHSA